jgi:hypothetical protein
MGRSHTHLKKTETAMRKSMISLLLLATAIPASAQTAQPPANPDANTPAVNSPNSSPNPELPSPVRTVSPKARQNHALKKKASATCLT